jgi:long-chain acyl-CoA synthetase
VRSPLSSETCLILPSIYAAVKAQMNTPGLKGALLRRAVATKLENLHNSGELKHTVYDALVFRKVRDG